MTAEQKAAKRAYDIARRQSYKQRKRELRKGWKASERAAVVKRQVKRSCWAGILLSNARYRAAKRGIEFSISRDDLIIPEYCPVLGMKLAMGTGGSFAARDCAPSLDRIHNAIGYVRGNIRVISWRANRLKNDATLDELVAILKYVRGEIP